ncbi:hypothetical protein GOBAR_DD11299 [Gossypium barbadense]|nr:hypothetical protein GOBAR_DD11299 [Gossypium barbadense]
MALRVKSSENMKKTAEETVVSEREKRPKSKSRLKSKLKKRTKIEDFCSYFVAEIECPVRDIKLTDFFIFLYSKEDFRKEFQEQNTDIKSMRDVEKCMARLQELQLTVAGGSKVISGVVFNLKDEELYSKEITSWEVSNHCRRRMSLPTMLVGETSLMEKDDSKCGQNAVVERKIVLVPKSETIVHAIITNVKTFDYQLSNGDMKPIKEGLNGLKTTRKQRSKGRK